MSDKEALEARARGMLATLSPEEKYKAWSAFHDEVVPQSDLDEDLMPLALMIARGETGFSGRRWTDNELPRTFLIAARHAHNEQLSAVTETRHGRS